MSYVCPSTRQILILSVAKNLRCTAQSLGSLLPSSQAMRRASSACDVVLQCKILLYVTYADNEIS